MATGDFTTIPRGLIMSLNCITEENRKDNNTNTEILLAMWRPCICNSKYSSNSGNSFHKDFLERVRKEANLLNFVRSHSWGNVRLTCLLLAFLFIVDPFGTPGPQSITRHTTTEIVQDELSAWFLQEKLMQQSQPITSKRVSVTLPGTADPESLEKLRISTWTIQAFSFTKLFDLPVLTQLSFPKQPVSGQVRNKSTLYLFQMDLKHTMQVNIFSSKKKSIYCQLHNDRVQKILCQESFKNAATNLKI